ncbi:MAG TPA: peptidylprolyl isomerase [Anaerolineales bacterium]|nr:peptidylprolyl isomerase [Anaerolineales bacterium]
MSTKQQKVEKDAVVTLEYTLKVGGEVVDSSEGHEPIQFLQGHGQIIPGLERAIEGMEVGESKNVVVPPAEGYGEIDEDAFTEISRSEFPTNIPLQPGVEVQVRDEEGEILDAYIASVTNDTVRLNFNHPLAGQELDFAVTIVEIRAATEEELEHGHVHGEDDEEWDEDWDEEDEEWDDEEDEDWEEDGDWEDENWEDDEDWSDDQDD